MGKQLQQLYCTRTYLDPSPGYHGAAVHQEDYIFRAAVLHYHFLPGLPERVSEAPIFASARVGRGGWVAGCSLEKAVAIKIWLVCDAKVWAAVTVFAG